MIQILLIIGIILFAIVKYSLSTGTNSGQTIPDLPPEVMDFPPVHRSPSISEESRGNNTRRPSPPPIPDKERIALLEEEQTQEQEFDIRSVDEVRRGIIWSEILNRKY